eukprot:m.28803 g.28803  ORF g.28803 m.28803 type:complete len:478 (+) comp11883_c0_seq2:147-1580(+)
MATNPSPLEGALTPTPTALGEAKTGGSTPTALKTPPDVFTFDVACSTEGSVVPSPRRHVKEGAGHLSADLLLATESPEVPVELPTKKKATKKKKILKKRRSVTFDELYEMGDLLGKGAFSVVNECMEKATRNSLAVKIMFKANSHYKRAQVLEEVDILMRARDHPNVIYFHKFIEEPDRFCLVFEKLDGGDLFECIKGLTAFTERQASLVIRDVSRGLAFLHNKGIAHRDLKPANVLCLFPGKVIPAKIADFNLATMVKVEGELIRPLTTPVGTPEFMSPELASAISLGEEARYTTSSDLWSLGVIAYVILSGRPPFKGTDGSLDSNELNEQRATLNTETLLEEIAEGKFSFLSVDWKHVSGAAKDLIGRLLVRAEDRLTAYNVLRHPWVRSEAPAIGLKTPAIFRDKEKRKQLMRFAKQANATHRKMASTSIDGLKLANPSSSKYTAWMPMSFQGPCVTLGDKSDVVGWMMGFYPI